MSRAWIVACALLLLMVLPDTVLACPVCFSASDENRAAFLATTAFLSLLPLGMVGGAGLWIRKRSRDVDALDRAASEGDEAELGGDGLGR